MFSVALNIASEAKDSSKNVSLLVFNLDGFQDIFIYSFCSLPFCSLGTSTFLWWPSICQNSVLLALLRCSSGWFAPCSDSFGHLWFPPINHLSPNGFLFITSELFNFSKPKNPFLQADPPSGGLNKPWEPKTKFCSFTLKASCVARWTPKAWGGTF